jgi:peptidoglycan/LPS O-acetylase OafA/YrhL
MGNSNIPSNRYRSDIDGLRAIAILMVIIYHAFPRLIKGGFVGVDVFFVISGYLISDIILRELAENRFTFATFYARRARRLFPALITVLTVVLVSGWFLLWSSEYKSLGQSAAAGAGFIANILYFTQSGYFDTVSTEKPLLHLWSLGVEEQFYLIWPTILIIAHRYSSSWLPLCLGGLSFVLCIFLTQSHIDAAFYLPTSRIWEFTLGYWASLSSRHGDPTIFSRRGLRAGRVHVALADGLSILGLGLLLFGYITIDHADAFPGYLAAYPALGAALLLLAGPRGIINRKFLSRGWLVYIGLISYPLYLWHWPLIAFENLIDYGEKTRWVSLSLLIGSIVLADLTWRYIENPIRFSRRNWTPWALFLVLMLTGATGAAIAYLEGIPTRFDERNSRLLKSSGEAITTSSKWEKYCPTEIALSDESIEACQRLMPKGETKRNIALVGDSHAISFADALTTVSEDRKVAFTGQILAKGGCMPFPWLEKSASSNECHPFLNSVFKYIENPVNADTIILVGRWASRFDGEGFGVDKKQHRFMDIHAERTETQSALFVRVLKEFLDQHQNGKQQIIFVHQVPELGFNMKSCISRPFSFKPVNDCTISRAQVERRQGGYRNAVKSLLSQYPNVIVFDPMNVLCDDTRCYGRRDDVFLYLDNNHLSVQGAHVLGQALTTVIH